MAKKSKGHTGKQDRGHTHAHMGNHGGKDSMASSEFHKHNKAHGMGGGFHGKMEEGCGDESADSSTEKYDEI